MLGDESVLLDLRARQYLSSNASAALLIQHLSTGASVDELAQVLVETYELEPAAARDDVEEFLDLLETHGLLELVP